MRKKYSKPLVAIFVTLIFALFNSLAFGKEFTAILTATSSRFGEVDKFKIYVKDHQYLLIPLKRIQLPVLQGNRATKSVRALYTRQKEYEVLDAEQFIFVDPDLTSQLLKAEKKFAATETVNGYQCDKYIYVLKPEKRNTVWKQICMEVWISKDLNHFIKWIFHQDSSDTLWQLEEIKEGPIKETKFQIPQGYKQIDEQ